MPAGRAGEGGFKMEKQLFFAKKIKPGWDGPHRRTRRVAYHCACGRVEGVDSDGDWRDGVSPIHDEILAANGETNPERLDKVLAFFGWEGHRC
ncbi:hypothetical protein A2Y83_04485 [Candidatus Falkowbacteria bacterium RBG_13_39_14]|uniref:Uncharacterized protein n=1 Tax=Candidatus Falkowbacteria bacterium RBG_13_39_14 TaxID=1797985 RepID=A0A1F5S4E0_9BACT|nr:MAG: hypothetical protein A2Y83_04485 [Candidatus Falkowbacteria bacterium RBG_13_39_14]